MRLQGVFAILYLVAMIVAEYYTGDYPNPGPVKVKPDHWTDVFLVVPQVCFGYQVNTSMEIWRHVEFRLLF